MKIGKIQKLVKKYLDKEWGKLDFKYELEDDSISVVADNLDKMRGGFERFDGNLYYGKWVGCI